MARRPERFRVVLPGLVEAGGADEPVEDDAVDVDHASCARGGTQPPKTFSSDCAAAMVR